LSEWLILFTPLYGLYLYPFFEANKQLINLIYKIQEESRSISENVTWGQRKRFADGKVSMPYKRFLGYEKGGDGSPEIVEIEAEIVRMIYRMFMEGKTPSIIARQLTTSGIPSPGGEKKWQVATVDSILTNEKYKGDALLQKHFTVDFLSKKIKENEGEVP
jgi:DNA invertase Pin-like site-specific DNA recombinase